MRKMNLLTRFSAMAIVMSGCVSEPRLLSEKTEQGYLIKEGEQPVLFFQLAPKSINGKFERAGYVHPLYDWQGRELTEDGPADHPHHRGIFWAWHQVRLGSRQVGDGWVSDKIRFVPGNNHIEKGEGSITIESDMEWVADSLPGGSKALISERARVCVYASVDSFRLIDFSIRLKALHDSVAIGGSKDVKGYGGFSTRWKLPADLQFFSGDSLLLPRDTAVSGGAWINFVGSFNNGEKQAVSLFCQKPYPGPDQQWILRGPAGPSMQNALFPGAESVPVSRMGLQLQYRIVLQKYPLSVTTLDKLFNEYHAASGL